MSTTYVTPQYSKLAKAGPARLAYEKRITEIMSSGKAGFFSDLAALKKAAEEEDDYPPPVVSTSSLVVSTRSPVIVQYDATAIPTINSASRSIVNVNTPPKAPSIGVYDSLITEFVEREDFDEESDSDGDEYLAPMEDHHYSPFQSENHITTLKQGEVLVGGKPPVHRGNGRRRPKQKRKVTDTSFTRINNPRDMVSSEATVRLIYTSTGNITNGGSAVAGQRWHTNAPYDVDPIFGSTAMAGYTQWAAFYHFVRALRYRIIIEVTNNEPNPVTVFFMHTNNDQGTAGTSAQAQAGNPLTRTLLLAPNGYGGTKRLIMSHTISQVVGSPAPKTEDNYRSLTNAIPADLTWFGVYLNMGSVNTLTAFKGVQYSLRIEQICHFYGRNVLTA